METETVIKKILPYLKRRGYDVEQDFDFEIGLPQFHWLWTGFRRRVKVAGSGGLCYTCVMGTWKSKNRHKYLLQYHIIFGKDIQIIYENIS